MKYGNKILRIITIPLITLVVVETLSVANGVKLFETSLSWVTFIRAICNVVLVTYALSINLNSGRFDFSIGSVALVSSIVSSLITLKFNCSPLLMLIISVVSGLLFGLISGGVYVLVKLPPIIVSLGVAMFYEGLAFTLTDGHGVSFVSNKDILAFSNITLYLIIILLTLIFMYVVFDCTKFGYDYKALLSGQKVSVNTGIKEIPNVLVCYAISGALMGLYGFVTATNNGSIQISLNFGSISPMFMAFLPMFIGGYIGSMLNDKVGYFLGAVSMALISLLYVRLNISSSVQQIVSALLLVGFLIYLNNQHKLKQLFSRKQIEVKNA